MRHASENMQRRLYVGNVRQLQHAGERVHAKYRDVLRESAHRMYLRGDLQFILPVGKLCHGLV